ncbi:MAG: DUF4065 domain-containing protein [Pedobacter sp.]|nr:MAG: DUF4065 domain-containing protein [Pedobacter sp.]
MSNCDMTSTQFHIEFNEKKTINAVLFIVNRIQRTDFHKIFKILYFSDRDHMATYGRGITGDNYCAMVDGPVPSKLYDIFKSVRGDGYFKDDGKFSAYFSIENWDLVKPKTDANLKALSKSDIDFLTANIQKYGEMAFEEIREISHDYAWQNTAPNHIISYDNIISETGEDASFIAFAKEQSFISSLIKK